MTQQYKIALIGEAWGRQEELLGKPFIGAAGDLLNQLLTDAGIMPDAKDPFVERDKHVFITNTFNFRPPASDNDIKSICVKRKDLPAGGKGYPLPPLTSGFYVKPEYLPELARLKTELETIKPNIAIALGGTALWALTQCVGIEKYRGATMESSLVSGLKVIATYHPASLFRVWNRRHVVIADLMKAKAESERPDISRLKREIWLEPSLGDLDRYWDEHLAGASLISIDIENPRDIISCISFAPSPTSAIVVPFEDERKPANSYWPTRADEIAAWRWVKRVCECPIPKLMQNGLYDCAHLEIAGIFTRNFLEDSMLLHHALQPEERKGLGHLGSLHANESAWKQMGNVRGDKTIKRDA